jgi:hemerythrin-like domain-containing protein
MCDYCDCRSHAEIAGLSEDHEALGDLLADLVDALNAGDRSGWVEAVRALAAILEPHAHREEAGVFTQLRRADVDSAYVDLFESDHADLTAILGPALDDPAAARHLAQHLAGHIAREESDLFPAAHQLLSPAQWEVIAGASA